MGGGFKQAILSLIGYQIALSGMFSPKWHMLLVISMCPILLPETKDLITSYFRQGLFVFMSTHFILLVSNIFLKIIS